MSVPMSIRTRGFAARALPVGLAAAFLATASPMRAEDAPAAAELGAFCFADGSEKSLLPDGALWAARMIHGETDGDPTAEESAAMLWAMAQRTYWSPTWRPRSYGDLVQAYSQPISKKWSRTGKACRKYYADGYEGEIPDNCSEKRTARRAKYRGLAWSEIDETARSAVREFAAGRTANPVPGAVGWWAESLYQARERKGSNARDHTALHSVIEKNAFMVATGPNTSLDTRAWTGAEVQVVGPGESCPAPDAVSKRSADDSEVAAVEGPPKMGRVEKKPEAKVQSRVASEGCTPAQETAIEEARRSAAIRSQVATDRARGVHPTTGDRDRREAESTSYRVIDSELDFDQVVEVSENIRDKVSNMGLRVSCESARNPNCAVRSAYVEDLSPPIHVCPGFFESSAEQRTRTLIHESAHLTGIKEKGDAESYCVLFDCQTRCGDFYTADAWAHFIHCAAGQPADAYDD